MVEASQLIKSMESKGTSYNEFINTLVEMFGERKPEVIVTHRGRKAS
jgi:hypothetical protein